MHSKPPIQCEFQNSLPFPEMKRTASVRLSTLCFWPFQNNSLVGYPTYWAIGLCAIFPIAENNYIQSCCFVWSEGSTYQFSTWYLFTSNLQIHPQVSERNCFSKTQTYPFLVAPETNDEQGWNVSWMERSFGLLLLKSLYTVDFLPSLPIYSLISYQPLILNPESDHWFIYFSLDYTDWQAALPDWTVCMQSICSTTDSSVLDISAQK